MAEKYRIRVLIGRGSMGSVYEVEDVATGALGALKVLLPEVARNPEIAARLAREGRALRLLSHPHIIRLLDTGALSDGTPFIITELAGGTTLRAIMDAGAIEQRRALAIVRQMLDALEHAHSHGIIHRDVKPENVIIQADELTGEDVVKFLDFGVAKLVDDTRRLLGEAKLTQVGFELFGSPHYVAPEVVVGGDVGTRADIYSTGAVLFELLAGVPPFDDTDPVALLQKQAASPAPTLAQRAPARSFAPELELLVADALAKEQARRFASAGAMIAALDATLRSLQATDPTATEISPPSPPPMPLPIVHVEEPGPAIARAHTPIGPPTGAPLPERVLRWLRAHRTASLFAGGAILLVLVIAILNTRSSHQSMRGAAGTAAPAGESTARRADPATPLQQADSDLARGATLDAVSEYERALSADSTLATSVQIRQNLVAIASGKDTVAAVIALDLLARNVSPPARDAIAAVASKHASRDVRQRALAIAVRDEFVETVDRLQLYVLDLQQAKTCPERRTIIAKLRELGDARAVTALRRAKAQYACIEREATDALATLESKPR